MDCEGGNEPVLMRYRNYEVGIFWTGEIYHFDMRRGGCGVPHQGGDIFCIDILIENIKFLIFKMIF